MNKVKIRKINNLRAWITLTKYSFLASSRNFSTIFFGFLFPFIFISVFGLIGRNGGSYEVYIRNDTASETQFFKTVQDSGLINFNTTKTQDEINEALKKGQVAVAATITEESVEVSPGLFIPKTKISLELSSASQNAPIVKSIFENFANSFNYQSLPDQSKTVAIDTSTIEGRRYEQIDFILPGQLGFALLSSGMFGVAFSFITLRKTLVLKRIFATPTPKWVVLAGEVTAKIIMAILQAAIIILVGHFLFNFTLANGIFTFISMIFVSIFALVVFMSFGLLIASIAKTEDSASPLANLISLPQFILAGSFFPIDVFPEFLQPIARILPLTFLNDALRKISFEGADLISVTPQLLGLIIWGIVIYSLVIRIFKWEE